MKSKKINLFNTSYTQGRFRVESTTIFSSINLSSIYCPPPPAPRPCRHGNRAGFWTRSHDAGSHDHGEDDRNLAWTFCVSECVCVCVCGASPPCVALYYVLAALHTNKLTRLYLLFVKHYSMLSLLYTRIQGYFGQINVCFTHTYSHTLRFPFFYISLEYMMHFQGAPVHLCQYACFSCSHDFAWSTIDIEEKENSP